MLPDWPPLGRIPRSAVAKFLFFIALVFAGFSALRWTPLGHYLEPEALVATLTELRSAWWSPIALIATHAVVAPLGAPISPVILAGGAVFGTLWGMLYNTVGTFLGAGVSYLLARSLGREFFVHAGGDRLRQAEKLLERRGFWALVRVRFLPLPFAVVNFGAALAGVPLPLFLGASVVGLAPPCLLFTHLAAALSSAAAERRGVIVAQVALALGLLLALSFLPALWSRMRRRRQARSLPARQRSDADSTP